MYDPSQENNGQRKSLVLPGLLTGKTLAWDPHEMEPTQKEAEPFEPWIQLCLKDTLDLAVTCTNRFPFLLDGSESVFLSCVTPHPIHVTEAPKLETPWITLAPAQRR